MNTEKSYGASLLRFWPLGALAIAAVGISLALPKASHSDGAKPESSHYLSTPPKGMAVATLSGGCFWSMEAMYKRLKGVVSAEPGYAGGTTKNPTYEGVETGSTGHAESVNVIYDPKVISYADLVQIDLTIPNPTTPNQQGDDVGTNYRSIVFYRTPEEKKIAQDMIKKVQASGIWNAPIVTEVKPLTKFWPAEAYHDNYYDTHTSEGYCSVVITPKIEKLKAHFGDKLKK